jgi:predicted alpha/beta superfamily hydrolase
MDVLPGSTLMVTNSKPVPIYVLDAPTDFPMAASTARLMQWGGEVPPCLTIGIGYADAETGDKENWRSRDLTPNKTPGINRSGSTDGFGAGPAFRRFLVETLRPMIERRFDVDGARSVLVGHSLAGMFTLDTMVQSPTAFANYLAMSPALWFDEELVLRQLKASLENGTTFPGRVAVFAGEQEERISRPSAHMTSNTLEFGRLVADHRGRFPAGAMVKVLPDTTHHTIIGPALAKGLRFLIAPEARRMETF